MSLSPNDSRDLAEAASCVVLNIGTIHSDLFEVKLQAGLKANREKKAIVIDPVGVGASMSRMSPCRDLVFRLGPTVIRGNASEIVALTAGTLSTRQRGVDSSLDLSPNRVLEAAQKLAGLAGSIVAVTGETDLVTDGTRTETISGGSPTLTRITGSGCLLSALVGAFVGANPGDPFLATVAAMDLLKTCGKLAADNLSHPDALGEFHYRLIDALAMS
jgi:hydroxyethylthiazole kinase